MTAIVRDHRTPSGPIVRDHRTPQQSTGPVVRDHRTQQPTGPVVRDHRSGSSSAPGGVTVRDHRGEGFDGTVRDHRHLGTVRDHRHHHHGLFSSFIDKMKELFGKRGGSAAEIQALQSVGQPATAAPPVSNMPRPPVQLSSTPSSFPGAPSFTSSAAAAAAAAATAAISGATGGFISTGNTTQDLANSIANAPTYSATEQALLNTIKDPQQRAIQELQMQMQKQSLLTTCLTNLANMRHEMAKAVAGNLRG